MSTAVSTASEGIRFERAYTPTSICSPARASILTGQFPHEHGMLNCHVDDSVRPNIDRDAPSFGRLLSERGYEMSCMGKWHVSRDLTPEDFGFDYMGDPFDQEAFREHGVEPGSVCDDLVSLVDLCPTFAEMAGTTAPGEVHGRSLAPLLQGETPCDWRDVVVAEYHGDEFGLYT